MDQSLGEFDGVAASSAMVKLGNWARPTCPHFGKLNCETWLIESTQLVNQCRKQISLEVALVIHGHPALEAKSSPVFGVDFDRSQLRKS